MILVIIIAAAWIVILAPSLMKRRSQSVGEIGSISHFHRQLRVLEHSGPEPIVAPAYRLRAVDGGAPATQVPGRPEAGRPRALGGRGQPTAPARAGLPAVERAGRRAAAGDRPARKDANGSSSAM